MSTFCCPNCQWQGLNCTGELYRYVCGHCLKVWEIIDVQAEEFTDGNMDTPLLVETAESMLDALIDDFHRREEKGGAS